MGGSWQCMQWVHAVIRSQVIYIMCLIYTAYIDTFGSVVDCKLANDG